MPKLIDNSVLIGNVLHEWSIAEYEKHDRNTVWYVIMSIVGLVLVIYAIFSGNFLFALIIILFAIILFLQHHQEPITIPFKIAELGIIINNRFYPYTELSEFYIVYNPPEVKSLFIEPSSFSRPRLRIPLQDMDPNEIRNTLKEFLDEDLEKEDEPFSDMMARKWQLH